MIEDAEAAQASHAKIETESDQTTIYYTDGSGKGDQIGASAVALREGIFMKRHLGTKDISTVHVAELIEMAIAHFARTQLAKQGSDGQRPTKMVVFSDCQAAIQAVQNPKQSSGQYVTCRIYDHVRTLRLQTHASNDKQMPAVDQIPIEIRWIPAHAGIPGNESADVEAKLAAENAPGSEQGFLGSGPRQEADPGTRLMSIARREVQARVLDRWKWEWAREPTGRPTQRLVKAPDKKNLRLFETPAKGILVYPDPNAIDEDWALHFLYKINEAESDKCYCGEGSQTPRHVLLQCPLYADLRKQMLDKIRARSDLSQNQLTDYDAIVSHS